MPYKEPYLWVSDVSISLKGISVLKRAFILAN